MVLVRSARVVEMIVGHEVNISNLEDITDRFPQACLVKELDGLGLRVRERRNYALVRESLQRPDVVWVEPKGCECLTIQIADEVALLGVNPAIAPLNVIDGTPNVLLLPCAHFSLPVKVPDGLSEQLGHVGALFLHDIPDLVARDNVVLAPFKRRVEAEQTNNIGGVGVESLSRDEDKRQCRSAGRSQAQDKRTSPWFGRAGLYESQPGSRQGL